ncbi:MAG: DUF2723 domain-containing protein [Candidatus Goldiibacteriota bacterium]
MYLATASPAVYLGDSGETAAAAYTLGISHPPGYPLYIMGAKIFSLMPAGETAFRINIFSAFCSVLSLLILYKMVFYFLGRIKKDRMNIFYAGAAPVFLAAAPVYWFVSNNAKGGVYTLALLLFLVSFYAGVKYYFENSRKFFYLAAYAGGALAAAHFTYMFFLLAGGALLSAVFIKREKRFPFTGAALALFCACTPYLYIFIRSASEPLINWGGINNAGEAVKHILRSVYVHDSARAPLSAEAFFFKIRVLTGGLLRSFGPALVFFAAGAVYLYRKNRKALFFISALTAVFLSAIAAATGNEPYRYWYINSFFYIPVYLFISVFIAFGAAAAADFARRQKKNTVLFVLAYAVLSALWTGAGSYAKNNHSLKFMGYDYPNNLFSGLKAGESVFMSDDLSVFTALYSKYVLGKHKELNLYDRNANVLDLSIYRPYDIKITRSRQRAAEREIAMRAPGRVNYMDAMAFEEIGQRTQLFGMIHKMLPADVELRNSGNLMETVVLRDYFRNDNQDYFYRQVIARHFIRFAGHAAAAGRTGEFDFYRKLAEETAPDINVIAKNIASIYFHEYRDGYNAAQYLEKAIRINNYDFTALKLLIYIYSLFDKQKAAQWTEFYHKKEWRDEE